MERPIAAAGQTETPPQKTVQGAKNPAAENPGAKSYADHCAICHGDQREGILPGFPPLVGISHQLSNDKMTALIHAGKGRMPGFPNLQGGEMSALLHFLTTADAAAKPAPAGGKTGAPSGLAEAGGELFHQNCAFCHGRDAMGGESGPDLTQSKLVLGDKTGEKIAQVVHEGRPDNKMPAFNFSSQEINGIIAFIHAREAAAAAHPGGRRGVTVEDLQTGKVDAGKQYFNGAGGCAKCHSPRGDLAGVARRYQGLQLEQRMLYPRGAKSTVTVTLENGETVAGTEAYLDEFTVALRDSNGVYRSWPTNRVHYTVQAPVEAHVEQFSKYTDDDIHNLMAYLQTLR
ncbi:MAG TPA: c-type cytochrome [Terracidiphilus sp.]|jgi:mono/diheme cytochrome c family protein